jgi:hypothetical protein
MMAVTESDHGPVGFYAAGAPSADYLWLALTPDRAAPSADVPVLALPCDWTAHQASSKQHIVEDHPLFREQTYHALSRQDAAQ